ncbi:MAG: LysM peptidoglycan-binding domain-containing M23 family metallopeptidase [Anaerolineales bacterium]
MNKNSELVFSWFLWFVAISLIFGAAYFAWKGYSPAQIKAGYQNQPIPAAINVSQDPGEIRIPDFILDTQQTSIHRAALVNTTIPKRKNINPLTYEVISNDSVFGIAAHYDLEPETILWSNYDVLQDNPHTLKPGMVLVIPPLDGLIYEWQDGDDVESVATTFNTESGLILNWIGNSLDLVNPEFKPGDLVMIPEGKREFQQWILPTIARGVAGVSAGVYGEGACVGPFDGLYGSSDFIWPTLGHTLSGNDYWSGHLAIDIGLVVGEAVLASDSGVVVFSGWATGGYGYVIIIDHGTGYQTLYAHLNAALAYCGSSVVQGQTIGLGGNTGNSSGAHLHFEVRYQGGFVSPWYVLPPP